MKTCLQNACTQAVISFFYSERRNFTIVLKRSLVFFTQNTKFYSCTQTAIRFSQRNTKFRVALKRPLVLWLQNTKFLKLLRNSHLPFDSKLKKCKVASKLSFVFWPQNTKFYKILVTVIQFLSTNNKNRIYLLFQ